MCEACKSGWLIEAVNEGMVDPTADILEDIRIRINSGSIDYLGIEAALKLKFPKYATMFNGIRGYTVVNFKQLEQGCPICAAARKDIRNRSLDSIMSQATRALRAGTVGRTIVKSPLYAQTHPNCKCSFVLKHQLSTGAPLKYFNSAFPAIEVSSRGIIGSGVSSIQTLQKQIVSRVDAILKTLEAKGLTQKYVLENKKDIEVPEKKIELVDDAKNVVEQPAKPEVEEIK